MKLGIAYNAFDALELLEASIDTVRPLADFIVVIYQEVSNFGEPLSQRDRSFLDALRQSGKVDLFYEYEPTVGRGGHMNELAKRNLGKNLCKNEHCTHHMTMDVDELYVTEKLKYAIDQMATGNWDASACQMQTYWKSPSFVLDPPEEYYVPLIYTIDDRMFDLRNRWGIPTDPTRRLTSNRIRIFERHEIQMHHLSYVRLDIGTKLRNSSASSNFSKKIDRIIAHFNQWEPGQQAYLAGIEERWHNVKVVDPLFNIANLNETK